VSAPNQDNAPPRGPWELVDALWEHNQTAAFAAAKELLAVDPRCRPRPAPAECAAMRRAIVKMQKFSTAPSEQKDPGQ